MATHAAGVLTAHISIEELPTLQGFGLPISTQQGYQHYRGVDGRYIHSRATNTAGITIANTCIYRGRLSVVDVPRLQTESGQIAPTSLSAQSHSAWSSTPWQLLRYPWEPSNLLPLMGSEPARPDRPRQNNNNTAGVLTAHISIAGLPSLTEC